MSNQIHVITTEMAIYRLVKYGPDVYKVYRIQGELSNPIETVVIDGPVTIKSSSTPCVWENRLPFLGDFVKFCSPDCYVQVITSRVLEIDNLGEVNEQKS